MTLNTWRNAARYCKDTFGAYVDWGECYFHCPVCDEPIYKVDWEDCADWAGCPVCEKAWEEIEG